MKTFSLDFKNTLDKVSSQEKELIKDLGVVWVFENVLTAAMHQVYKEGLPLREAKLFGRLSHRLNAVPTDALELSVEDAEYDFIRSVFSNDGVRFPLGQSALIAVLMDNLDSAK